MNFVRHGAQGQMDGASKATLENEFGTHNDEEVITQILEKGTLQESEVCSLLTSSPSLASFFVTGFPIDDLILTVSQHRLRRDKETRTIAWVPEPHTRDVEVRLRWRV
jgi:Shwachman-Bodian-Diamond syndrome (SBDS) protein